MFREEVGNLTALGSTYEGAAKVAVGQCGQGYVETVGTSGGWEVVGSRGRLWAVLVGVVVSVGLLW